LGNLALNLYLTPRWGITGAATSLILSYFIVIGWYLLKIPKDPIQPASLPTPETKPAKISL